MKLFLKILLLIIIVSGAAGAGAGYWASNSSLLVNGVNSPIARSLVVSPIASAAGHVAGGTVANLIGKQNFGDAFSNSFQGIWQNVAIGTAIGVGTTTAVSYASGVDPINGKNIYPSNSGFKGQTMSTELQPGQIIDRYGNTDGNFFAPEGTPIGNRSLHPSTNTDSYSSYQVVKPLPVQSGTTAPYYGQPGGGTQYYSPLNTPQLINEGYIIRIK